MPASAAAAQPTSADRRGLWPRPSGPAQTAKPRARRGTARRRTQGWWWSSSEGLRPVGQHRCRLWRERLVREAAGHRAAAEEAQSRGSRAGGVRGRVRVAREQLHYAHRRRSCFEELQVYSIDMHPYSLLASGDGRVRPGPGRGVRVQAALSGRWRRFRFAGTQNLILFSKAHFMKLKTSLSCDPITTSCVCLNEFE